MSFVLDVPVQLFMTFLLALPAGEANRPFAENNSDHATPTIVRMHQAYGEGAFKFGEQTWLAALKIKPSAPEVERYSRRIFKTSTGLHYVPRATERRAILALREIPAVAQGVAARLAQYNARQLRKTLGRPADVTELYLAHRLGVEAAASLVSYISVRPNEPAYFYVAKVAPDFLVEDLVPTPGTTLADLKKLLKRSILEAKRNAASQNLLSTLQADLRGSFAAIVASSNGEKSVASNTQQSMHQRR
ncbi:MAG: hypothetical protein ACRBCJ_04920 [Hyphomicrobiaceae bacterium]